MNRNASRFASILLPALALATPSLTHVHACPEPHPHPGSPTATAPEPIPNAARPVIQIALLLDTSGSMHGLIDQARTRLWDIVNDLSTARRDGQPPRLEVALYQYGSDDLPSSEGFLTMVLPFTTDLDDISEKLFALRINGHAEYCGWAIDSAAKHLAWKRNATQSPHESSLRIIVIAGNESFDQGPVKYQSAIEQAKSRAVIVNTIYCGPYAEGERSGWLTAAYLAGGAYHAIDQNIRIEHIPAPQDAEILRLNNELNATYLPYGSRGEILAGRQAAQDAANLQASPSAALSRASAKAGDNYTNAHWDLIDGLDRGLVTLETLPTADLPPVMRPMTLEARREYIAATRAKRAAIRAQIRELTAARNAFLADRRAKPPHAQTLDSAIIRSIREQARRLGFVFPD